MGTQGRQDACTGRGGSGEGRLDYRREAIGNGVTCSGRQEESEIEAGEEALG